MATTDPSSTMHGPRYAPDDPSLPEPWKPLIDGSTGRLYYWNPETNVTQYERPGSLPHAVKAGEPPLVNVQSEGMHTMQYQQRGQGQLMNTLAQPQTQVGQWASQQTAPPRQHLGPHSGTSPHPVHATSEQFRAEMTQHATVQLPPQVGKVPQQQGHPLTQHSTQQGQQAPQQSVRPMPQVQQGPGFQTAPHSTCYQYIPQPTQHMLHQPGMREQSAVLQGPQSSVQPSQYLPQGQQLPLTPEKPHSSLQPTHYLAQGQQLPPTQENKVVPGVKNEVERHRGLSINLPQKKPSPQAHHGVEELVHQEHVSISQNRMVSGLMHGQPQNITHGGPGPKLPYDENNHGRSTNDFFVNNSRDVNTMPPQLPKLAPLPIPRNQPEIRSSGFSPQTVMPQGRPNDPAGIPMHGAFGQSSSVHHYPDSSFMRPPMPILGPSDSNDLSAAEAYRQKHEVTAMGENVPAPFMTFEAAGLPPEILQEIRFAGFSAPTPIQAQTWPIALMNRDIVAIAKTGSGKTLGYLIPAFIHLRRRHNNPQFGPTVLVLAPTRELATQIQDEAVKFARSSRVSCTCLYGGAPKGPQLRELEQGADIVVATPGRLNDILDMKKIDFRQVSFLVLDEADRMLDMGFEPQIRKIVNEIPPRRQTLMYTATWPKDVVKIASDLLINPVQVNIGSVDELEANKSITQYVEVVPEMEKQRRLEQIIRSQERGSKVIIFCSTKKLCDQLAYSLKRFCGALAIHGDKSQGERDWVLNQFRSGKSQVLVATDVAARGLDIRDIRVVINYDFPTGIEDYVHRIGRTGRAGATGVAYTFFAEQDWKYAPNLIKVLEGANQVVPPEIRDIALRGGSNFGKDRAMINRYAPTDGPGRWNPSDRGDTRDSGFAGRGGMRDGPFPGRGGDGSFRGRGGMSDGGFGGRGGMREGNFRGRGGGREGNFFSPSGGRGGWDRGGRVGDRFGNMDSRGRGRGRGRGRFDSRRDGSDRGRDRSFSRSPERGRTWGYSRSRSRSSSHSRRRSYSRSRSRSRSWSRSRSPRRSYSRSRSPSYERTARRPRVSKFDQMAPDTEIPSGSGTMHIPPSGGPDRATDAWYPSNGTGPTGSISDR